MLLVASAPAAVAAQPAPGEDGGAEVVPIGRLMVTSRVGGHFANPVCREERTLVPADIARTLEWLRRDARAGGGPVLYDTGGLLAPHGVARFAAAHAPESFARMVDELGYRALAFGQAELGAPREGMVSTVRALRERRVPVIATNLYCDPAKRTLCDALVDGSDGISIHRIGNERVAFIAMIAPGALERVAPERAAGLRLAPLEQTMAAAVREARELGASLVIASIDEGTGQGAAARQLELAGALPEDARPDLLLAAAAGAEFLFARPLGFEPALAAAPPGGAARIRLRRSVVADSLDVLVRPTPAADAPHPAVRRFIERLGPAYCQRWGHGLAGGRVPDPFGAPQMLELAAGTARRATEADLALVPRSILDPAWDPASSEGLTASDVYVALKQDEPLLVGDAEGQWIDKVAKGEGKKHFAMPGIAVEEGSVKLHGRPIEPRARYRVVTVRPATVGPHALPEGPEWKVRSDQTLRSVLLSHLEEPRDEGPLEALPDPARQPEWLLRTELRATFAGTTSRNPDDYPDQSQLQRASASTYGLQATLRADATAKHWGWENVLESRYRITTAVGAADTEGNDLSSLRSTMRYRGWREKRPRFYIPEPFVELYVETEFTVPDERAFRHFLVRPTAGLRLELTEHLSFKGLGGFEVEVFDDETGVLPGAGAQLVLKPWTLVAAGDRKLTLEGTADYFVSDLGGVNRQTLRGSFKARYELDATLAFGWDLELFVVRDKDPMTNEARPTGVSLVNSAFVQLGWIGRAF